MSTSSEVSDFKVQLDEIALRLHQVILASAHAVDRKAIEEFAYEHSMLSTCIAWERFLHRIFLEHILHDTTTFQGDLSIRLAQSITSNFGEPVALLAKYRVQKKLTLKKLESLIDPKGFNISFPKASKISEKASKFMIAARAMKFALNADELALIDAVVSIRNVIVHSSDQANATLTSHLNDISSTGPNALLKGKHKKLGVYLKKEIGGTRRFDHCLNSLKDIADKWA